MAVLVPNDRPTRHAAATSLSPRSRTIALVSRRDDVLLQLAIRLHVRGDRKLGLREGQGVTAHLHAPALARRADGERLRFAEWREAGLVVVQCGGIEIAVGV